VSQRFSGYCPWLIEIEKVKSDTHGDRFEFKTSTADASATFAAAEA